MTDKTTETFVVLMEATFDVSRQLPICPLFLKRVVRCGARHWLLRGGFSPFYSSLEVSSVYRCTSSQSDPPTRWEPSLRLGG